MEDRLKIVIEMLENELHSLNRQSAMSGEGQNYRNRKFDSIQYALEILKKQK